MRVIAEVRPRFVCRENPAKVRADAPWCGDRFSAALEAVGYATAPVQVGACCMGFDHQRRRLFVYAELADSDCQRLEERQAQFGFAPEDPWWPSIPRRVVVANGAASHTRGSRANNGVADRIHRLRALGNGIVPAVAFRAWNELSK